MILTSDEESVAREDDFLAPLFHEIADAVLRMTRRMQSSHFDAVADLESLLVLWSLCDFCAVLAADDGHLVGLELVDKSQRSVLLILNVGRG